MKLLIDGDILTFRAAFSAEDEEEAWIPCSRAESMIAEIRADTGVHDAEIWLSGPDNFRYEVYPEYKANRIGMKRPKWEKEVKQYLTEVCEANWTHGHEADDALGYRCMETGGIIVTIDKDLNMIPGLHYNFVKKEKYYVSPEEADRFFFYQLIIGDTVDNIKGVPGLGPKKAEKLLLQGNSPKEWLELIQDQYSCEEELEMNAKCLWIWRQLHDNWRNVLV